MDKELVKRYHLEEALKRYQQINEYSFVTEQGEEDEQQPPQDGGMQPPQPPQGGQGDMQPPQQPPMPQDQGGQMPPMDNNAPQGDMGQGGDMNAPMPPMDDNMEQPMGDEGMPAPEGDMDTEMPEDGGDMDNVDTMQPDDEVIDVDELTQAQETNEYKIDGVDEKLTALLKIVDKWSKAIDDNTRKVEDLQQELAMRNPTEKERLNIRSQQSMPFGESPKEYWEKKTSDPNSNYEVMFNNDIAPSQEQKQYTITKGDIDSMNDKEVMKTMDFPNLKLKDYFE